MDMRAGSRKAFGDNKPIKSPARFHHPIRPRSKAGWRSPSDQESKLGRASYHWNIERTLVRGRSERPSREDQEGCTITRRFPANTLAYSGRRRGSSDASKDFDAVSDSGWGTESEGDKHDPGKIGKQNTESLLGKADCIIDHIGESWESEFSAQVEPIKADYKSLAHRVQNLMLIEASIAQNMRNSVETSQADDRELLNGVTGNFGETLEKAVNINVSILHLIFYNGTIHSNNEFHLIQDTIQDLQRKIKVLDERMKKKKDEFIHDLAALKAKNREEIEEFQEDLARETASLPAKIQAAKSNKADQKQVQLKLAKILADGLP